MKVDHIGIAVKNLKVVIEKFKKVHTDLQLHTEKSKDGEMEIAFLKFENIEIELLESLKEESVINRFIQKKGEGIHHIALEVKNINESMDKLNNSHIRLINNKPKIGSKDSLVTFLHPKDFNGVLVELCQKKCKKGMKIFFKKVI